MTDEQWLANAPQGIRSVVTNAMAVEAAEKTKLIAQITANKANTFNPDWLKTQDVAFLRNLANIAAQPQQQPGPPMYLGAGGAPPMLNTGGSAVADEEPLTVPTMNFDAKEGEKLTAAK
jgi:hypothetical protein